MSIATEVEPLAIEAPEFEVDDGPGIEECLYRRTVEPYHMMADAGVFGDETRVELLDGLLVRKMTQKPPRVIAGGLVEIFLHRIAPPGWYASTTKPMAIDERDSEPEPDVQLVRGGPRDYPNKNPGPEAAGLVVEISHSSYRIDRKTKMVIYAAAGIQTFWLLDLNRRRLEVFTDPTGPTESPTYRIIRTLGPEDEVAVTLDGVEVGRAAVRELLP